MAALRLAVRTGPRGRHDRRGAGVRGRHHAGERARQGLGMALGRHEPRRHRGPGPRLASHARGRDRTRPRRRGAVRGQRVLRLEVAPRVARARVARHDGKRPALASGRAPAGARGDVGRDPPPSPPRRPTHLDLRGRDAGIQLDAPRVHPVSLVALRHHGAQRRLLLSHLRRCGSADAGVRRGAGQRPLRRGADDAARSGAVRVGLRLDPARRLGRDVPPVPDAAAARDGALVSGQLGARQPPGGQT